MAKKRKLILFTHHFSSQPLLQGGRAQEKNSGFFFAIFYYPGLLIYWSGKIFLQLVAFFISQLGAFIYRIPSFFLAARLWAGLEIANTRDNAKKRQQMFFHKLFFQSVALFSVLCLGSAGLFFGAHLVAKGLQIKNNALDLSMSGKNFLLGAEEDLKANNLSGAQNNFARAIKDFDAGKQEIGDAGLLINQIANVLPQKRAADSLLSAASLLSQAGDNLVRFYAASQDISFSSQGLSSNQSLAGVLVSMKNLLHSALAQVTEAQKAVDGVKASDLPSSQQEMFAQMKGKVDIAGSSFQNVADLFDILTSLCPGQKRLLFIFQNNNELRPTGGFLGTYGDFQMSDCKITSQKISSIYDLDGQLMETIKPPTPLLNVNDRWYMRDSNWFADFPTSAKKMAQFYEKEGGETPDLVIALDPSLMVDLLAITGPIQLPEFNVTLTTDNFVEQTQVLTSNTYQSPTNEPKQMLAAFFPIMLQKLFSLPKGQGGAFLEVLQNSLNAKHMLLYSRDESVQKALSAYHWTGEVGQSDRDYLQIVNSNLGGTKTDLFVDESIKLQSTVTDDGEILNQLVINRTNRMPTGHGTANVSFIRVLVPQGSELLSDIGFDYKVIPDAPDPQYKIDDQVFAWEKNSVNAVITGTTIGKESGKTFFGNWQTLEGGQTKTITITYKLPFTLQNIDKQSILIQKQPGTNAYPFTYTLNFGNRTMEWNNMTGANVQSTEASLQFPLGKDYFLASVLHKK